MTSSHSQMERQQQKQQQLVAKQNVLRILASSQWEHVANKQEGSLLESAAFKHIHVKQ